MNFKRCKPQTKSVGDVELLVLTCDLSIFAEADWNVQFNSVI